MPNIQGYRINRCETNAPAALTSGSGLCIFLRLGERGVGLPDQLGNCRAVCWRDIGFGETLPRYGRHFVQRLHQPFVRVHRADDEAGVILV